MPSAPVSVWKQRLRRVRWIAKFWLADIWRGDWDRYRRRQLFKHYRAYIRNPPIPAECLLDSASRDEQAAFSRAYLEKLRSLHESEARRHGVFLTFRPLGKNLRLVGTEVCEQADRNRAVFIVPAGPSAERKALARNGLKWDPWVWVRSPDGGSADQLNVAAAWNALFRNPPASRRDDGKARQVAIPRLGTGDGQFSARSLEQVLKVATATRYVFSPVESLMAKIDRTKQAMDWPARSRPVLGMHIRRGDAASVEADGIPPQKCTRRSFALKTHLEVADRLCEKYGIRDVFLATESREEIDGAVRLRPQYRFYWVDHDRSIFPNIRESRQDIEFVALEHPERARAVAESAILDLSFFCDCAAFVGAFNSEFSVLAWLLTVGSSGRLVPYVSLSTPLHRRRLDHLTVGLTRGENCPLEFWLPSVVCGDPRPAPLCKVTPSTA